MRQSFEVPWKLSGLNEYTRACRANRYKGAAMKRTNQDIAALSIRAARLKPYDGPVRVSITWVEPNMRRDPDNIRFAAKFVLDALVEEGVLPNDTQRYVKGISDRFLVNRNNPRIIVEIEEV
ncbi:RusA family crossover junction endodeoxyribonuclease [Gordonibacter urolithinfaciens]|uniref:RusA family crossover junction endodeoxyribonuclease n=1 Tax=Gordonibacter urolithinfaciens TaxID=1335613 RepID=A0A6N8IJL7_9ACTN|nr:RusA family crossover junction endodeoxyribonuclease [Gordonibacter urolithinfaciens]MVM54519.1 RusA family crossover junction endodeoxyribonuclease [Gordonibacter urolithinfaciens]MVN15003.1 RusA family crossover junction endodeoxyribonuclease [Gordonibacter urolithinfaciens]MVN38512.1 RusA family crossover junction endodeoxyribonuclease [Gordonibacter urolithinfaciens]MVN55170.1 RusA family crossover junction endodeoxyribonuclease [Gordonibacter urolithinfaciens]MVN60588.1 RusA family cro